IQKDVGITFVYVTHDQEEALTMSDRLAVLANGQIEQIGSPVDVYERPATEFVAGFIGISNVLTRDGVRFVVRPEKIRMLAEGEEADPGMTVELGRVEEVIYVGMNTRYVVHLDRGEQLVAVRQNMDAWGGYVQSLWQKPFEQQTGCKITYKDAGSSDEMVSLMAGGGGGQWDMVSASGDADLRLLYNGDVKPMNMELIPDWQNFQPNFKSPPFNTISGIHYGVSLQ